MISPATGIGAATLLIAALLVIKNLKTWFTTPRKPLSVLFPGIQGLVAGVSATLCTGGVIGWAASMIAGAANSVSGVIPWATGTQDESVDAGTTSGLNIWGGGVAFIIVVIYLLALRPLFSNPSDQDKTRRLRLIGGLVVGVCLTYTAGVAAAVTSYVIPWYNSAGEFLPTALNSMLGAVS